jgi:hypothetical protein
VLFGEQDQSYRDLVLPPDILPRVAVEQASALGWERWTGGQGTVIAMRSFGASGPGRDVRRHFGFTAMAVSEAVRAALADTAGQPRGRVTPTTRCEPMTSASRTGAQRQSPLWPLVIIDR